MKPDSTARFLQSINDFPIMVRLGREAPTWELNRWGRDALRFIPVEHDRYHVRGDKRRLLYRGARESHRFTILDTDHFEYDIILKREPETNTLYCLLDGWEHYDFLRQPDRYGPALLRGSYAVYKKDNELNTYRSSIGTGKLCHIHRPQIIDARGREVWGDVWIADGLMRITIPERWLGEAAYPVVVDPVIGSSSVGVYNTFRYMNETAYNDYLADKLDDTTVNIADYSDIWKIYLEEMTVLNKWVSPCALEGNYNTYLYVNETNKNRACTAWPMVYSDNNNHPTLFLGNSTAYVDCQVHSSTAAKWYKATINLKSIAANTPIWFGFNGNNGIGLRFDYGAAYFCNYSGYLYKEWAQDYTSFVNCLKGQDLYDIGGQIDFYNDTLSDEGNVYPGQRKDFKISMYLEVPAQNYTRTITQGVKLTDKQNRIQALVKKLTQTSKAAHTTSRAYTAIRKLTQNVTLTEKPDRILNLVKILTQQIKLSHTNSRVHNAVRKLVQTAPSVESMKRWGTFFRVQKDSGTIREAVQRSVGFFVKLMTTGFMRDYVLHRFLKSREELVVKSPVCREIEITSKIQ